MSTIIERIKELCSQMRMSENKFASEIGVNTQTLNNYTTGKRSVSYDVVDKILVHFPQVSAEWLIRGVGSMCCSPASDAEIFGERGTSEETRNQSRQVADSGSSEMLALKDERIKLLEQQVRFLEQQLDVYRNNA